MTTRDIQIILAKLDDLELEVRSLRTEVERVRGAWWLARSIISLLGLAGLGSLVTWIASQGK
jgi:hypothetical protein